MDANASLRVVGDWQLNNQFKLEANFNERKEVANSGKSYDS